MNKDVLLTPEEIKEISDDLAHADFDRPFALEFGERVGKKVALKLLDVLKGHCSNGLHNLDGDLTRRKYECSECMAEIEKLLKEG